jgi:hypothetical protein
MMSKYALETEQDDNNVYTGNCAMHIFKTALDDDAFEHIFRVAKNEIPNCDVKDRNVTKDEDEDPIEGYTKPKQSISNKSFPKSEIFVSNDADHGVSSCANHAQFFEDAQLRSIFNLGNIRGGELNSNEPKGADYKIKKRDEAFKDRAKEAWNSMVKNRNRSRFNSGS